jgi:hypothetical protein
MRAIVAAVVVSFVMISSYAYISDQNFASSTSTDADQNFTTISDTATNTTTYSRATVTSQSLSTTITPPQVSNPSTVGTLPRQQGFGNSNFEPPSAILIPANTLVWTDFRLDGVTNFANAQVYGNFYLFPFPGAIGANVSVAIYVNGSLNDKSTLSVIAQGGIINSSSLVPPSDSANNSIFALTGVTPVVVVSDSSLSFLSLKGTVISIAFFSQSPIWLAGWTQSDMSGGSGAQFGQSTGQLAGTYEADVSGTLFPPGSLPNATAVLTFQLQISGNMVQE